MCHKTPRLLHPIIVTQMNFLSFISPSENKWLNRIHLGKQCSYRYDVCIFGGEVSGSYRRGASVIIAGFDPIRALESHCTGLDVIVMCDPYRQRSHTNQPHNGLLKLHI
jgi:hypothetical protein